MLSEPEIIIATNLEECRTEAEFSDGAGTLFAILYEDDIGWQFEPTPEGIALNLSNELIERAKSHLMRYVNRKGKNAPHDTTHGGLSLWLMLKDDGTAMGLPYYTSAPLDK
jgi:hypothetical protein